jgi:hydroxymethylpyrimidine pyrophosphatase-like HAD family hydrolase
MLLYAGHGIAMGNATAPAKEAAEFVTTDIHDDGILHAMEHYGLIKKI